MNFFSPLGKAYCLIISLPGLISFLGSDRLNLSSCKYQTVWIFISLQEQVGRKDSAAGDVTAVMGEGPKIHLAFRWATVSRAEAQTAKAAAIWHRTNDSPFIPGKQEFEKIHAVMDYLITLLKRWARPSSFSF